MTNKPCGMRLSFDLAYGESKDQMSISKGYDTFDALEMTEKYFRDEIQKTIEFVKNAGSGYWWRIYCFIESNGDRCFYS